MDLSKEERGVNRLDVLEQISRQHNATVRYPSTTGHERIGIIPLARY